MGSAGQDDVGSFVGSCAGSAAVVIVVGTFVVDVDAGWGPPTVG